MTIALIIVGIVILLGLIGLGVWWALRKKPLENGFEIEYDITVHLSPMTKYVTPKMVTEWTDSLVQHWNEKKGWSIKEIKETLAGTHVHMLDSTFIACDLDGVKATIEKASGLAYIGSKVIYITTQQEPHGKLDKRRVWSLWRHELSHMPVAKIGQLWTNEESHALYKETGLGA